MSQITPAMSGEDLHELVGLLREVDSVELKLTVPEGSGRSALAALDIDPLNAQIRQVVFFDTPDLTLDQQGIVVRARRVQGVGDDSVVKLRPIVPADLPATFRRSPNLFVEVDAMPGGFVCSASMKRTLDQTDVRRVVKGERAVRKLFSKEQRAFFAAHAPAGIELDDLSVLGPITVLKLKFAPVGFGRRIVAELWTYPDGSRILELSTKCGPNEGFQVAAEAKAFLASNGVEVGGVQSTKTRTALEFFSTELQAAAR